MAREAVRQLASSKLERCGRFKISIGFWLCRPAWLVLTGLMMAGSCAVTALAETPSALYLSAVCSGVAYGGFWGIMPATASDVRSALRLIKSVATVMPHLQSG